MDMKCVECGKIKEVVGRGMCKACYGRWAYYRVPSQERNRQYMLRTKKRRNEAITGYIAEWAKRLGIDDSIVPKAAEDVDKVMRSGLLLRVVCAASLYYYSKELRRCIPMRSLEIVTGVKRRLIGKYYRDIAKLHKRDELSPCVAGYVDFACDKLATQEVTIFDRSTSTWRSGKRDISIPEIRAKARMLMKSIPAIRRSPKAVCGGAVWLASVWQASKMGKRDLAPTQHEIGECLDSCEVTVRNGAHEILEHLGITRPSNKGGGRPVVSGVVEGLERRFT